MLSAVIATTAVPGRARAVPAADAAAVERWIVVLKDSVADPGAVANQHAQSEGKGRVRHVYNAAAGGNALKGYALEATATQIQAIRADPRVASVERDQKVSLPKPLKGAAPRARRKLSGTPGSGGVRYAGDPLLAGQWGPFRIGTVGGADKGFTVPAPARVGVAELDSGVDFNHPDLRVAGSVNFSDAPTADDLLGHGTHVAGIIQALNNGIGVEGTAPGTKLWNVKVLGDDGTADFSDLVAGLDWVTRNAKAKNIRVANMSLTSPVSSPALHEAVRVATRAGVTVSAAAGNESTNQPQYPAAYPEAIGVAATTVFNQRADFSNYGATWVDIAAPGTDILSTGPTHPNGFFLPEYAYLSGTSMATPFASGTIALCLTSGHCRGTTNDILATLGRDSLRISGTGTDYRYGLVQAACYWQHIPKCHSITVGRGKVVSRKSLKARTQPTSHSAEAGNLRPGQTITIDCKAKGQWVKGNNIWYKLGQNPRGWAPARHIKNLNAIPYCT
ncbi:S8 family serine peptidase [Streptomyces sp. SLBN-118]|uniref:S8 family serine peptidase n=1 Tax=Streptomyces sp. SLBN-118 TaxID=2768454 RepID=UPI001356BB2C|nr:S8 family serine peptidase [Streptomyces sp. SLBN-118]